MGVSPWQLGAVGYKKYIKRKQKPRLRDASVFVTVAFINGDISLCCLDLYMPSIPCTRRRNFNYTADHLCSALLPFIESLIIWCWKPWEVPIAHCELVGAITASTIIIELRGTTVYLLQPIVFGMFNAWFGPVAPYMFIFREIIPNIIPVFFMVKIYFWRYLVCLNRFVDNYLGFVLNLCRQIPPKSINMIHTFHWQIFGYMINGVMVDQEFVNSAV